MSWYDKHLFRWKFRQMRRRSRWPWRCQTIRQDIGIWLLTNIPHPEIDCGSDAVEGAGVRGCTVPSARGYVCRRHVVEETWNRQLELLDLKEV